MTDDLKAMDEKAARLEARRNYRTTKSRRQHAVIIISACSLAAAIGLVKIDLPLMSALVGAVGVIGAIWGEALVTLSMEYPE